MFCGDAKAQADASYRNLHGRSNFAFDIAGRAVSTADCRQGLLPITEILPMKNTITICENALDSSTWVTHEDIDDVREFLVSQFGTWPDTARIYLDHVANNADITPVDEAGIDRLGRVQGHIYVVVYPEGIELILIIVAVVIAAVSIALTFLFRPSANAPSNQQTSSANNQLSNRTNEARPNQRIPDIFGELWATFDLLAVPYTTFVNNVEYEHCYMCIGRGDYDIAVVNGVVQLRDSITPLSAIDGASANIFGPGTSPNSGVPRQVVGAPLSTAPIGTFLGAMTVSIAGNERHTHGVGVEPDINYDEGTVTISISSASGVNFAAGATYGEGSTPGSVASDLVDRINELATGNLLATLSGSLITITVTPLGTSAGYSIGCDAHTDDPSEFSGSSFTATPSTSSFGAPISPYFNERVLNLQIFDSVNGQLLQAPNLCAFLARVAPFGTNNLRFRSPNIIENGTGNPALGWTVGFQPNDTLNIGGLLDGDSIAVDPAGLKPTIDLAGAYIIISTSPTQIVLDAPQLVNSAWAALADFAGGVSAFGNDNLIANNTFWIGPFFIARTDITRIMCNFVAEQGSYEVDSSNGSQIQINTTIIVGVTPCDPMGVPEGGEVTHVTTLFGSHADKQAKGVTLSTNVICGTGGILIRARRSSLTDIRVGFQVSDAVQWRDLYLCSDVGNIDFGNITSVQTLIKATPSALAVKERKMNALVTRKVPLHVIGPTFGGLVASKNAADIICAMALDPYIGNRTVDELDVDGIYSVAGPGGLVETYFGIQAYLTAATEFCYTFDDAKVSFEESIADIAQAIFCIAYRRGAILTLSFERQTANSTLLFNHRNKIPKSETRTVTFGSVNDNDGITLDYVEPNAPNFPNLDTVKTLYFPLDQSAVNPKQVTAVGVRNKYQAMILGWRLYKKLTCQNTTVQFDATEEAALLVLQDRILVADNSRSDTQDGDVIAQTALLLTLSQPVVFDARFTYTIFLQGADGTIESIAITAGPKADQVLLATAPAQPCVVDPGTYARTTYMIVSSAPTRQNAFLLAEKTPKDAKVYEVKAVNYDDAYYTHDLDYRSDVIVAALYLDVVTRDGSSVLHTNTYQVKGRGFRTQFTGRGGVDTGQNWSQLRKDPGTIPLNGSYNYDHVVGHSDTFDMDTVPAFSVSFVSATLRAYAKKNGPSARQIALVQDRTLSSQIHLLGVAQNLTNNFAWYTQDVSNDSFSGLPITNPTSLNDTWYGYAIIT